MDRNGVIAFSAGLMLAGLLTACGDSPTGSSRVLPPNLDGTYTVRFDSTCADLPAELRSRTYRASIVGSPQIVVTLTGADFWTHPTYGLLNRFTGSFLTENSVFFQLRAADWGIVEQIGAMSYFEIIGVGSGSIRDSTIEGRLSAGVGFGSDLRDDAHHVGCGPGHALTFRFTRE